MLITFILEDYVSIEERVERVSYLLNAWTPRYYEIVDWEIERANCLLEIRCNTASSESENLAACPSNWYMP